MKKYMAFHMAWILSGAGDTPITLGSAVDYGPEYFVNVLIELKISKVSLDIDDLKPNHASVIGVTRWYFCVGDHASAIGGIVGSTKIAVRGDSSRLD